MTIDEGKTRLSWDFLKLKIILKIHISHYSIFYICQN
jgi:hypothetical protein